MVTRDPNHECPYVRSNTINDKSSPSHVSDIDKILDFIFIYFRDIAQTCVRKVKSWVHWSRLPR